MREEVSDVNLSGSVVAGGFVTDLPDHLVVAVTVH